MAEYPTLNAKKREGCHSGLGLKDKEGYLHRDKKQMFCK